MKNKELYPVGLSFPLARGNNGYFNQNFNTIDQAYTNIKNLLFTSFYERRLNINFGSKIPYLLFEQVESEDDIADSVKTSIENSINYYFPHVDVLEIITKFSDVNINMVTIKIKFALKNATRSSYNEKETRTLDFTFKG